MSSASGLAGAVGGRAAQTVVARILSALLAFAAGVVVARAFGPAGKGAYNAVAALIAVPTAVTLGASSAITYALVREGRTMRYLFPVLTVVFAGACAVIAGAAVVYGALRGWSAVTIAVASIIPAAVVISMQDSYFVSSGRITRLNVLTLSLQSVTLAGCAAAVLTGLPVAAAIAAYVAANYAVAALVLADMIRAAGAWDAHGLRARLREFLRIAVPAGLNTSLGVLNYRVDSYILLGLLGIAPFGLYSVAVNGGEILLWLSRPIATVMSREIGGADDERSSELTACTIRVSAALTALCGAVLLLLAPVLVHAVYGGRFSAAVAPLRLLLPGVVAVSSFGAFASYFIIRLGRPLAITTINAAMVVVQAAACFAFVPRYGMSGAALSSTLTYLFGAAASTWYFCRCSGMSPAQVWMLQPRDAVRISRAAAGVLPAAFTAWATRKP